MSLIWTYNVDSFPASTAGAILTGIGLLYHNFQTNCSKWLKTSDVYNAEVLIIIQKDE